MSVTTIFCADPLQNRRIDPHYAAEARTVRDLGGVTAIIDHDALLRGDAATAVRRVREGTGAAWYRGWMIPGERYAELAAALDRRGTQLVTGPTAYRRAHELPGWYDTFASVTPPSVWSRGAPDDVGALVAPLGAGPGIVKDYVKSRKHEWHDACYLPELTDVDAVRRVIATFVERQAEFLAGGVVVRRFESFAEGESRVWWLDGDPVAISPHPDTPSLDPRPDLAHIRPLVRAFPARFVTTDLARRVDGVWRLVEVGDGQVSDWPAGSDHLTLMSRLMTAPTGRAGS